MGFEQKYLWVFFSEKGVPQGSDGFQYLTREEIVAKGVGEYGFDDKFEEAIKNLPVGVTHLVIDVPMFLAGQE